MLSVGGDKPQRCNSLVQDLQFCQGRTIYENIYEEQEKHVKYTSLLANCVILDNTIEISAALNALAKEGCIPTLDELAALSPYYRAP